MKQDKKENGKITIYGNKYKLRKNWTCYGKRLEFKQTFLNLDDAEKCLEWLNNLNDKNKTKLQLRQVTPESLSWKGCKLFIRGPNGINTNGKKKKKIKQEFKPYKINSYRKSLPNGVYTSQSKVSPFKFEIIRNYETAFSKCFEKKQLAIKFAKFFENLSLENQEKVYTREISPEQAGWNPENLKKS